jgi:hypothetical protein
MDNLETIMQQNQNLVREAVFEYLIKIFCPSDFGLKNAERHNLCADCWDKALKNQD